MPVLTPSNLFHTPSDQEELITWINNHPADSRATLVTVMGMTWNLAAKLVAEEQEEPTNGN